MKYWITTFLFLIVCAVPFALADNGAPLLDWSGNNNLVNGFNTVATYEQTDNAYSFPGLTTVSLNSTSSIISNSDLPFSVSAWIKINGTQPGNFRRIMGEERTSSNVTWIFLTGSGNQIGANMRTGGDACSGNADAYISVNTGQYYNLLITYDGSNFIKYLNGVQFDNDSIGSTLCKSNVPLNIGRTAGSPSGFNGSVSDVRIWQNKALNPSEVLTVYNNGSVSDGLVAFYPFRPVFPGSKGPGFDYSYNGFDLTCTNSPVYNTTTRSFIFGLAGNQKCDPAKNITTAELATNSSPYTELAWINMAAYTPTGSSYHLSNIGFEFATNRGYSHRFEYNSTAGFRGQVVAGGTFHTGSYVGGFTTNTWVPVIYEFTGTNILVYVNGTLSLNATSTGRALNTTGNNQFYGSGTGGGLANGMWNGTVKYHARYNRLLTPEEKQTWYNNETINTTGLVSWHTFENTTGVTATIGTTPIGPMPSHSLGFHGELFLANATLIDANNDGTLDTLANVTEYYNAWTQSGATADRWDINLDIVCTFNGTGCVWSYTNALNARNMSLHKSNYDKLIELGGKAVFILEATPSQLAINNSDCNYGAGSDWADCESIKFGVPGVVDYSDLVIAAADYINFMTDNWTNNEGLFCVETHNEPYLRQFWLTNSSVTTQHAITRMLVKHDAIAAGLRAEFPGIQICGPSVTYGSSAAGLEFMHGFYGNRTYGSLNAPDYANTHEYGSSGVMGIVRTNVEAAVGILNGYGYTNRIVVTETLTNNNDVSQFNQPRMEAETANAYYGAVLGGVQAMHVFRFSDSRPWGPATTEYPAKYPQYYLTALEGPYYGGGYQGVERVQYLQSGTQYYNCTTSDSSVTCLATRSGDKYYVSFANMKGNQIQIDTLTIPGATITAARMLTDTQPVAFSGDEAYLAYNNWYGVQTYEITVELTEISFNTTVPTSQSFSTTQGVPVSFTATMNNHDSLPLIYSWFINGVNQSSVYGDTTINTNLVSGNYTVNLSVYSSENTVSYLWNMEVLPAVPATACTETTAGVAGLGVFTQNIGILALAVMTVAIISLVYGITNGIGGAELVYVVLRNVVIAAVALIIIVFIVAIGSEIATNTVCR